MAKIVKGKGSIRAWDQWGARKEYYPIAFSVPYGQVKGLVQRLKQDGWHPIRHHGAQYAFQDSPGLGLLGRQHIVIHKIGSRGYVSAHVDTVVPHRKAPLETLNFIEVFKERYAGIPKLTRNTGGERLILLDLHSYPPGSDDYGKFDICLLEVSGITDRRFYKEMQRALRSKGLKVGLITVPRQRADIITQSKRECPDILPLLVEVNEDKAGSLPEIARVIASAITSVEENPRVIMRENQESAIDRYRIFHDFEPDKTMMLELPDVKGSLHPIGDVDAIVYWCSKWSARDPRKKNVRYIHRWERNKLIYAEDDAENPYLLGRCKVIEDGITDWSQKNTWRERATLSMPRNNTLTYIGICEEIRVNGEIIKPKRSILCTDGSGTYLYVVPLPEGVRPSHPEQFR